MDIDKPIFDAMRTVCGPLTQDHVSAMKVAIAASTQQNDKPIFDVVHRYDDDQDGLSKLEFEIVKRGITAFYAHQPIASCRTRQISLDGIALLKRFEGLRLIAYLCPAKVWTIGYGSTGPNVKSGMQISEQQALALLDHDLDRFEEAVEKLAPSAKQHEFDAMVCLAFNVGIAAFRRSSVLQQHLAGNSLQAGNAFRLWNKANGQVLSGLVTRRGAERQLYLS